MKKFDIIIIGAGTSGCALAQYYASISKKVLVIEERNQIAGNCYDYPDGNGTLVSKCEAHDPHASPKDIQVHYFSDKNEVAEKMLDHPYIDIMLNTDYFDIRNEITGYEKLFFTEL